jgi:hypothetical protein
MAQGQRRRRLREKTVEIHDPGNESDIEDLFVFMSVDEQGRKGICGGMFPGLGATPMVTAKPNIVEMMKETAQQLSRATGKRIQLYRFRRAPDVLWQTGDQ